MGKVIPCGTKVAMQHAGKALVSWQDADAVQAWRCSECGYIYFDTPDLGFLREYYQVKYLEDKSWYNLKNDWNEEHCKHAASYVCSVARKWIQTDQVFYHESGCAFGGIVRKLNQLGFRATGTELNETVVAEARAAGNESVYACTDRELFVEKSDRADLVYGFHCLEHMPFPTQYLTELRDILSPRGVALFHVPNAVAANSLLRGFDKNSWFAYPDHLHMFSPSSIICLAESAEFDVLDIRTDLLTDERSKDAEMLGGADAASIHGRIFNEIIQDGLLGQEICFVITPSGSETAEKHAETIAATRKRTINFRAREITYLKLQAEDGARPSDSTAVARSNRVGKVIPCGTKIAMQHAGKPLVLWQNADAIQAWRCSKCGYIYFDTPDLGFLRDYHQVKYLEDKSWYNLKNDWNEDRCANATSYVRNVARKWLQTDQVFYHESGCAFGGIVRKLNQLGFRATGTEPNETAVAEARAAGNESVYGCADRELFSEKSDRADLVYSFHCLDHMPFPTQYLTELRNILSPHGVALFHVPNAVAANSLLRGFDKNSWFAYPDHLHMFSPSSIICLAESAEFDVLDIRTNLLTDNSSKDSEILGGADAASIRGRIFNEIIQDGLLGQEICFVITPSGSETAEKHAETIAATRKRTINFRTREITYLKLQAEDGAR